MVGLSICVRTRTGVGHERARTGRRVKVLLTDGQPSRGPLLVLSVVIEQLELMLSLPVTQQGSVLTEQNREAVIDTADPDRKPGRLQHAAHLETGAGT